MQRFYKWGAVLFKMCGSDSQDVGCGTTLFCNGDALASGLCAAQDDRDSFVGELTSDNVFPS